MLTLKELSRELGVHPTTLYRWARELRGDPASPFRPKPWRGDLEEVRALAEQRAADAEGRVGRPLQTKPKDPHPHPREEPEAAPPSGCIDPELQRELEAALENCGDAPLEREIMICGRLFERLGGIVLTWREDRLTRDTDDQRDFAALVRALSTLTGKLDGMKGRLIELQRRYGELLPADDVRVMLRALADQVVRGTDELVPAQVSAVLALVREHGSDVDGDQLQRALSASVLEWRDDLARRHAPQAEEKAA